MGSDTPTHASQTDAWYDWLVERRHGGDRAVEQVLLGRVARIRDRVLAGAKLTATGRILDVGSGDGLLSFGAFAEVGVTITAVLVDVSGPLLERAEQRAVELGVRERCSFLKSSAEDLVGVDNGSIDAVVTRATIAYVADKSRAMKEFHRVLRPGGRLSIAEPIHRDLALQTCQLLELIEEHPSDLDAARARLFLRWRAAQLAGTREEIQRSPITSFSERDLLSWCQNAGFTGIHLELHIDVGFSDPMRWETFLGIALHPMAPTTGEILRSHFSEVERRIFEAELRPLVESGKMVERVAIAYLTAVRP